MLAAVALAALVAAGPAAAQVPPDLSGVDQYVEQLPTGSGSKPSGVGGGKATPLPKNVRNALGQRGGRDAPLLEALATQPAFGAPGRELQNSARGDARDGGGGKAKEQAKAGGRGGGTSSGGGAGGAGGRPDGTTDVGGDISLGDAAASAVGALAQSDEGGGPSALLIALIVISGGLLFLAGWRTRRLRA